MLKRKRQKFIRRIMFTTSLFFILALLARGQSPPPASQFELYCQAGSTPLAPNGWTLDPSTGKYVAWVCVDINGQVTFPGISSGGTPGGNPFDIQFNNTGTFGGTDQFMTDTNGAVIIGPDPGSSAGEAALQVSQDGFSGDDVADFFLNGQGVASVFINSAGAFVVGNTETPTHAQAAATIIGDPGGTNDILDIALHGAPSAAASFDSLAGLHVPYCLGCNIMGPGSVPTTTGFTFGNQGTTTVTQKSNRLVFSVPDSNPTVEYRVYYVAYPTPPFTIDLAAAIVGFNTDSNGNNVGIAFLNSSTGAAHSFDYEWVGNAGASQGDTNVNAWTNFTTFGSQLASRNVTASMGTHFLRATDDGTNRDFYVSANGVDFVLMYTEADSAITVNAVGISLYNNSGGISFAPNDIVSVYNWTITNSILPVIN
jgi:hypothetical protein